MENYQLVIKAYDRLGTLERMLRVIRHRGGKIAAMNMQVEKGQQLSVTLSLVDSNTKQQISDQLRKLADIVTVS